MKAGPSPAGLPWRGPGPDRPELPLPPDQLPLRLGRVLRKRWRYVGVFCEELMLCAAGVEVGPMGQTFWAVLDRERGELIERTRLRPPRTQGEVWSERPGGGAWRLGEARPEVVTRIRSREVEAELRFGEGSWVEAICPNGAGGYVWTRKRIAPVEGELRLRDGRRWTLAARGIEDESAGYHPRHTVWSWSAGIGLAEDGRELGWNLVSGVNNPQAGSERAVWVDGEPLEPDPVRFEADLGAIGFADTSRLEFSAEAERQASANLGLVRFAYRQPFGSFSGSLAGIPLAEGLGVMERHDAWW